MLTVFSVHAQNSANEEVKRLQRSIFIFNFAQQVGGWPNFDQAETFKIGVLGPDRTIIDLNSLAGKRSIQDKMVEIKRFNLVKDIQDIHLLYVNNKYNFDINYILNKVSGKSILLVTENYNYHTSMINIVNVGNSFEYEINESLINDENFIIAPTLSKYAVSSALKWKELYESTEQRLSAVKEAEEKREQILKDKELQIISQEEIIKQQERAIDTSAKEVSERDAWIEKLHVENSLQQKKYEEKIHIEKELENNIQQQIDFIKVQNTAIAKSDSEIIRQKKYLQNQAIKIEEKEAVLKEKNQKINLHRRINLLLLVLAIMLLVGGILLYRGYLTTKRLELLLREKNESIKKQSELLKAQNTELEQFNYMATHDLKAPISNLEGYFSFLKSDLQTDDKELLDTIHWMGVLIEQAKQTISDLTVVTQTKNLKEQVEEIDLSEAIDEVLKGLQNDFQLHQITIVKKLDQCPQVQFGKIGLKSILQNLLSNAINYKDNSRDLHIEIRSNSEINYDTLSIKDNGLGIDKNQQGDQLFGLFKRINTNVEGSGIGLYIVKKIIENAGGKIEVESEINKGSTFKVFFKK